MTGTVLADDLEVPELDIFGPEFADDPWSVLSRARDDHWLARSALGYHVLTYATTNAVLRDQRFRWATDLGLEDAGPVRDLLLERSRRNLLQLEGDAHHRLRKLVSRAFTPRAAERWRQLAREVIDGLVGSVAPEGRCELVTDVAEPFPIMVICAVLGTPADDWRWFSAWAEQMFRRIQFNVDEAVAAQIWQSQVDMDRYLADLIERRRDDLGEDLCSDLIRAEEEGDRLSADEIVVLLDGILSAGIDTTRNQLAAGAWFLAAYPEQRDRLVHDSTLAPRAVDEVMRLRPAVAGTLRVATTDVELDGVTFPEGTVVGPTIAPANRDPAVYLDPDAFDIGRQQPAPPLSFGAGPHYCLGAHLARVELAEGLLSIAHQLEGLDLDGEVPWKSLVGISGPARLPLRWKVDTPV